jgi:photosystem II stability/assembly factor-like uncharacterized protein
MIRKSWCILITWAFIACVITSNISAETSFKQFTADAGWLATRVDLFWTSDGGHSWKDITPPAIASSKGIVAVFFVDTSTGWVVFSQQSDNAAVPVGFGLTSTANGGINWSSPETLMPDKWRHLSKGLELDINDQANIYFWDAEHGGVSLGGAFGIFMATADSGKTWRESPGPASNKWLFNSRSDGWSVGDSARFRSTLAATHDGGKSWTDVPLPGLPPPEEATINYDLPMFADKERGFLTVRYYGPRMEGTAIYSTTDGGRTWHHDYTLPYDLHGAVFTLLNSQLFVARVDDHRLSLGQPFAAPSNGGVVDSFIARVERLTFIDSSHAWAVADSQLLSTSDAGADWTNITPPSVKRVTPVPGIKTGPLPPPSKPSSTLNWTAPAVASQEVS